MRVHFIHKRKSRISAVRPHTPLRCLFPRQIHFNRALIYTVQLSACLHIFNFTVDILDNIHTAQFATPYKVLVPHLRTAMHRTTLQCGRQNVSHFGTRRGDTPETPKRTAQPFIEQCTHLIGRVLYNTAGHTSLFDKLIAPKYGRVAHCRTIFVQHNFHGSRLYGVCGVWCAKKLYTDAATQKYIGLTTRVNRFDTQLSAVLVRDLIYLWSLLGIESYYMIGFGGWWAAGFR